MGFIELGHGKVAILSNPATTQSLPRWKVIYDQLRGELSEFEYGSDFYTITDICKKFRVSTITAIHVLNELASEGLIEKISRKGNVVRQLKKEAFVRLILPERIRSDYQNFDPVIKRLMDGVSQAAQSQSLHFNTLAENYLQSLFPRPEQAFGFLVFRDVADQTIDFIKAHHLPYVMLDPLDVPRKTPYARVDRVQAGYLATRHLLDLGHRRIAWITAQNLSRNFRERVDGYRKALQEEGIPYLESLVKTTDGSVYRENEAALVELLKIRPKPTAIIAGDDNRAIHILDACRKLKIAVPEDMSILGYPNYPETDLTTPPLTVVDAHFEAVGSAAISLLLKQMFQKTDDTSQVAIISPDLVIRGSTGAAPEKNRSRRELVLSKSPSIS